MNNIQHINNNSYREEVKDEGDGREDKQFNSQPHPTDDWILETTSQTLQQQRQYQYDASSTAATDEDNLGIVTTANDSRTSAKLRSYNHQQQQRQEQSDDDVKERERSLIRTSTRPTSQQQQQQHDNDDSIVQPPQSREQECRRRQHQQEIEARPGAVAVFSDGEDVYITPLSKGRLSIQQQQQQEQCRENDDKNDDAIDGEKTGKKGLWPWVDFDEQLLRHCNQRKIVNMSMAVCVAIVIVIIVLLFLGRGEGDKNKSKKNGNYNSMLLLEELQQSLEHLTSPENVHVFDDSTTPQYKALRWLAFNDNDNANTTTFRTKRNIEIRYALAVLYFATNGPSLSWYYHSNFLSSHLHECNWTTTSATTNTDGDGRLLIICDSSNDEITSITIDDNNLHGFIPEEFLYALSSSLISLQITRNPFLTGSIPESLSRMTRLTSLDLSENALTNEVPPTIVAIEGLEILKLGYNSLTGKLMKRIIPSLYELRMLNVSGNPNLDDNAFETKFGEIMGFDFRLSLDHLEVFDISNCSFSGYLGLAQFDYHDKLKVLRIDHNNFLGLLPALGKSIEIFTARNNQFTGTFPWVKVEGQPRSGMFKNIMHIDVSENQIPGSLPDGVGEFTHLEYLDMSFNRIQSSLPSSLGKLAKLRNLLIQGNQITGFLPSELGKLDLLTAIDISQNDVEGDVGLLCSMLDDYNFTSTITADCLGSDPKLMCSCCDCI